MRPLLALIVLLAFPAGARAGTVEVRSATIELGGRSGTEVVHYMAFAAGPGEANDLRIAGTPQLVRLEDAGARLTAGPGCAPDGPAVTCAGAQLLDVTADMGDGNDRVAAVGLEASLAGGGGDDVLSVSGASGDLSGGDGDDTVIGGEWPDVFDPGSGRDIVEGRGGNDYGRRRAGLRSARRGRQRRPGRDLLYGSGGDDRYDGGPGKDVYDLEPYRRGGHIDVRCSSAADVIELDDLDVPSVRLRPRCRRLFLGNVELSFRRGFAAARTGGGLAPPPCRVQLATAHQVVTLGHLVYSRTRRARLHVPAAITVRFAGRCGGPYRTALHLRVG